MLNDNVDVFRAKSSGGGVRGNISSSSRVTLCPRTCSGEGDGRGRIDPLRGAGDNTVICCGERSGGGGMDGLYERWDGEGGDGEKESSEKTGGPSLSSSISAAPSAALGGAIAIGVSPSR